MRNQEDAKEQSAYDEKESGNNVTGRRGEKHSVSQTDCWRSKVTVRKRIVIGEVGKGIITRENRGVCVFLSSDFPLLISPSSH